MKQLEIQKRESDVAFDDIAIGDINFLKGRARTGSEAEPSLMKAQSHGQPQARMIAKNRIK